MQSKFIIDKEINLNESDFLKTKIYADNLSKIIRNAEVNKVFTIGVFGNWGTGKSSIVKTSNEYFEDENIKDENKNKKVKFITYDAWQYVNDSFRRMFLRKLREDLLYEETDLMSSFYENESTDVGNKYLLSPTRLAFILGGLIFILGVLTFIPFKIDYKIPIYAIFTLLGLLITIISGAFHQLKISVTKPHFFAPEQFEECFKEIVSNSLSKKTNRFLKWVKGDKSIQGLEKLVIVIDNIDRCSNDVAYNLLTDIKTFISSEPYSIVFVIPVDDEALKKHIIKNSITGTDCEKEKEEFLRKFFNVTIRIKPYSETDMYSFAKKICMQSGLSFKPETINIASKEYATNPRRIIQLFNNLSYMPFMALIAYKDSNNSSFYIESHSIDKKGKLLAGVPMSEACISELASSFSQEQQVTPTGIIPANLLYSDNRIGHQTYIWYNPPKKQMMYFSKSLNIPDGEYHIPGIVYVAKGSGLDIYAFKGRKPNILYKAPFFNTSNGKVCLGNAKIEYPQKPSFFDIIKYWEDKFWLTEFSHLGGDGNPTKNNLVVVTKNAKESFNYKELLPMNITIKNLLR